MQYVGMAYRDFLSQLYSYNSGLRVVTMTATYKNSMDFYRNYEQTGYKNIGSVIQPKFIMMLVYVNNNNNWR